MTETEICERCKCEKEPGDHVLPESCIRALKFNYLRVREELRETHRLYQKDIQENVELTVGKDVLTTRLKELSALNAQQAERIKELERDALLACANYIELVDALCSKAWRGRNRHSSVLALASRLKARQKTIVPLELEDVALAAGYCIRESGHSGPCNGLARNDCFVSEQALTAKEPKA